jgi:hypothetical protein
MMAFQALICARAETMVRGKNKLLVVVSCASRRSTSSPTSSPPPVFSPDQTDELPWSTAISNARGQSSMSRLDRRLRGKDLNKVLITITAGRCQDMSRDFQPYQDTNRFLVSPKSIGNPGVRRYHSTMSLRTLRIVRLGPFCGGTARRQIHLWPVSEDATSIGSHCG